MQLLPYKFSITCSSEGKISHQLHEAIKVPEKAVFNEKVCPMLQDLEDTYHSYLNKQISEKYFGVLLFQALFPGNLRLNYRKNFKYAEENGARLWIQVRFKDQCLDKFPWELAYDPEREVMLSSSPQTPFTRYCHEIDIQYNPSVIKILIYVCNPETKVLNHFLKQKNLPPVNGQLQVESELNHIISSLKLLHAKGLRIQYKILNNSDFPTFQAELNHEYHILHYIGDGIPVEPSPELLFYDHQQTIQSYDTTSLLTLLNERDIQFLFLNCCYGAKSSEDYCGIVQSFAKRGMPIVIAHKGSIPDNTAIHFVDTFYHMLAEGFPVPVCLNESRLKLAIDRQIELASNVIGYCQNMNGQLFDPESINPVWHQSQLEYTQKLDLLNETNQIKDEILKETILKLFGLTIFSWKTIQSTTALHLGEYDEKDYLKPLILKPYCSASVELPVLEWFIDEDIQNVHIELFEMSSENKIKQLISNDIIHSNFQKLDDLEIEWNNDASYHYQLNYKINEDLFTHYGIFYLLPDNEKESLNQSLSELEQNESLTSENRLLMKGALFYHYRLYDPLFDLLVSKIIDSKIETEIIPFLTLLRECYIKMQESFQGFQNYIEEDRLLKRLSALEYEINQLYKIEG